MNLIISQYDKAKKEMINVLSDNIDMVVEEELPNLKQYE